MQNQRENMDWVDSEFSTLSFRDERLTNRFLLTAKRMMSCPCSTLNQALTSRAEIKGAYRMFQNKDVDVDEIISSHQVELARRIKHEKIVLSIQDTSLLVYSGHKKTIGMGETGRVHSSSDKGLLLHSCLAVNSDGIPFGIFSHQCWARDRPYQKSDCRVTRIAKRHRLDVEERESFKWLRALEQTMKVSTGSDARIITVADREADYNLLMEKAIELGGGFVIRSRTNRLVFIDGQEQTTLHDQLANSLPLGQVKIAAPKYDDGKTRIVDAEIKFFAFKIRMREKNRKLSDKRILQVSAVEVCEIGPRRKNHLHWILLTSERVDNLQQAEKIVAWYRARWTVETYFKILKSGLKVEECRLGSADRLFRFIALASIIGYRILYLSRISRVDPDLSCEVALTKEEWKVLRISTLHKKNTSTSPPSIHEAVHMIAKLGGYQCRKTDPPPGPIVIWRGLKALHERVQIYEILLNPSANCGYQ